jgi:hypothetical protein
MADFNENTKEPSFTTETGNVLTNKAADTFSRKI